MEQMSYLNSRSIKLDKLLGDAITLSNEVKKASKKAKKESYIGGIFQDAVGRTYRLQLMHKSKEIRLNWDAAIKYAQNTKLFGHKDWVIPNKDELAYIYMSLNPIDTTDPRYKEGGKRTIEPCPYWTDAAHGSTVAWYQHMHNGKSAVADKSNDYYVRLIRRDYF